MTLAMSVLLLADLEGTTAFNGYAESRAELSKFIARDVNAAVRGLVRGGASVVDVIDAHGDGGNIDPQDLTAPARLLGGSLAIAELLLDRQRVAGYGAFVVVGQHAMAGTPDAFMPHTNAGRLIAHVKMNGRPIGEIAEWAWLAGSFGIPVAAVSGDRAACLEAEAFIPGVETAMVKTAEGSALVNCLAADQATQLIEEACYRGIAGIAQRSPAVLDGPVRMEVMFKTPDAIPMAAILPRSVISGTTVIYDASGFEEALHAFLCTLLLAGVAVMAKPR